MVNSNWSHHRLIVVVDWLTRTRWSNSNFARRTIFIFSEIFLNLNYTTLIRMKNSSKLAGRLCCCCPPSSEKWKLLVWNTQCDNNLCRARRLCGVRWWCACVRWSRPGKWTSWLSHRILDSFPLISATWFRSPAHYRSEKRLYKKTATLLSDDKSTHAQMCDFLEIIIKNCLNGRQRVGIFLTKTWTVSGQVAWIAADLGDPLEPNRANHATFFINLKELLLINRLKC